ncbi:cob(I)yrinic acid a,c-diamide adenosyltransferase [Alteromonas sp. ASW11-19]|uniref:Corrinoid adenosyltransferase n=1 Tax=Alteromonas salexigens TaxID=2982530 RepID=A0ABT2VM14_9ALTE|nr:cob(I)yrinic acid a,c-diamide adenosyltransferase [Alteromonas salexigens]MCU7553898.1 cob(I)yrinic acid a,c-diamide adenosyltransferase [Alteromonas salexigens]
MKIYTRTGDTGNTQVYATQTLRVSKDDILLDTYGDIDELNSHVGLLVCLLGEDHEERPFLEGIQRTLFQAGFAISASSTLTPDDVTTLEKAIDTHSENLPAPTQFLLPGGCQAAAQCHIARTVCRRAERTVTRLAGHHTVPEAVMAYLNRLSDYLYTLARTLNAQAGITPAPV